MKRTHYFIERGNFVNKEQSSCLLFLRDRIPYVAITMASSDFEPVLTKYQVPAAQGGCGPPPVLGGDSHSDMPISAAPPSEGSTILGGCPRLESFFVNAILVVLILVTIFLVTSLVRRMRGCSGPACACGHRGRCKCPPGCPRCGCTTGCTCGRRWCHCPSNDVCQCWRADTARY